jgi:tRNA (guanine37-N1)-methyltransferase
MEIEILSLFPEYFRGPFDVSMLKRAQENGLLTIRHTQIRDFAENKHKRVDDRPFGGGPGMVLSPEPVAKAIRSVKRPNSHVVYLTPQGSVLTAAKCQELSQKEHLIILCGHYEGVDERVLQKEVNEEISIGDYVLTNGCAAAIIVIDAMARFIPDVIGHPEAVQEDSFQNGIFDGPAYTRPENFEGMEVPEVLRGGHHAEIKEWRKTQALEKTRRVRPDLLFRR